MKTRNKSILLTVLTALFILHGIPVIGFYTPAIAYLLVVLLLYIVLARTVGVESFLWMMALVFPIICVPLLYSIVKLLRGNHDLAIETYNFLQLLLYPLLGIYVMRRGNKDFCMGIMRVILIGYAITCVTTILGCSIFPNAARVLTGGQDDLLLYARYKQMNIGDFHFVYFIALTLPLLIGSIRYNKIKKIIGFTLLVLVLVAIFYSSYTTALLFSLMSLLLFCVPKNISARRLVRLTLIAFLVSMIARTFLASVFEVFSGEMSNEDMSGRLGDMSILLRGGTTEQLGEESDVSTRLDLFTSSLKAFESNPIWGAWGSKPTGGHSYLFDTMGCFGLIGFSLLIWLYVRTYKLFLAPYKREPWFSYVLFSYLLVIFQSILNPNPSIMVISFLFPIYTRLMSKNKNLKQ